MNSSFLESLANERNLETAISELSKNSIDKIIFSTSFGLEDQAILHSIASQKIKNIDVFTIDTGRLFPETYATWDQTLLQYDIDIKSYNPTAKNVEEFTNKNGINAFYKSAKLRKECCYLRKVVPLKRAIGNAKLWITGLRAEQSANRNDLKIVQWDEQFQIYKYNPLLHWTFNEVNDYVKSNGIPYNPLHDKGFVSIGCAPCTRAIKENEDFRAGRWWWEDNSKKECGIHSK